MRFSVEYNPPITKHADRFIRLNITPSMTSEDQDSHQYPIDFVLESLEGENQDEVFKHDISYLKRLLEDKVSYIEI
jgi:hypothetical protein